MTTLAERSTIPIDPVGRPRLDVRPVNYWHQVATENGIRSICPTCWPDYQIVIKGMSGLGPISILRMSIENALAGRLQIASTLSCDVCAAVRS